MGSLRGVVTHAERGPADRSSFRTSWAQPEGAVGAFTFEAQVVDVNLVNWTVDVVTKFDQKYYLNIQVSSPYAHYNRGEGFYAMPDVGAKCLVHIPSDGPPPYVAGFIMPQETIDGASADSPVGTDASKGGVTQTATAASFAGGRRRAKPGDIGITNRDGSFVRLHRGGVLQIGATELSQRLFIPLQNLITDISQNYRHQSVNGSINWFMAQGESLDDPPSIYRHTCRVRANHDQATIRVAIGKVSDVFQEPDKETRGDLEALGIGGEPVVCEVVIAPEAISADDGSFTPAARGASVFRYFFDHAGNVLLRTEANVASHVKGRLRLRVNEDTEIFGGGNAHMEFKGTGKFTAKGGLDLNGAVIRLNEGKSPVARVGSRVTVVLAPPMTLQLLLPGTAPTGVPVAVLLPAALQGFVVDGNPTVLA